ncbi:hypothetical protein [Okeania sp. SIO3I5]|nr:hypothetical protein [Okeania sp. SIO3I5]
MFSHRLISSDVVNMPPVSLIKNVKLKGQYYRFNNIDIPANMEYCFNIA